MKVGVLALQGAVALHVEAFEVLGAAPVEVRCLDTLDSVAALVMPGGESTTISRLLTTAGLFDPLARRLREGLPVMGTCAGMILLASRVLDGRPDQRCLDAIDIDVRRNAFGRQVDSFEAALAIDGIEDGPFHGVFIRAPYVDRIGSGVDVLASVAGHAVACQQGRVLVTAFHPELATTASGGGDLRVHEHFLNLASS